MEPAYPGALAFRRLANQFCRLVGVHGEGIPPDQLGFENNGAARYPAYYQNLACDATDFRFVNMEPNSGLNVTAPDVVKAAYQNVMESYYNAAAYQTWPQTRLRRIYHWADDSDGGDWFDNLCNVPGDGTDPNQYYVNAAQKTLPAPGDYHRSLKLYNPRAY